MLGTVFVEFHSCWIHAEMKFLKKVGFVDFLDFVLGFFGFFLFCKSITFFHFPPFFLSTIFTLRCWPGIHIHVVGSFSKFQIFFLICEFLPLSRSISIFLKNGRI